ncbi:hypothetical protein HYV72_01710, partial [Candidatus Uhrbacteria bacterium]|nr:hypothetical protein [Candidatus Uhrbacteria bacterium]
MGFNVQRIVLICGAAALFFGYAWLMLSVPGEWNSPDEAAVAYLAEFGLKTQAPYAELGNLVHPRSLIVVQGFFVPSSWLGLPWLLRALFQLTHLPVATLALLIPALAVAAVFAWGYAVRMWTRSALAGGIAAFLLGVHP